MDQRGMNKGNTVHTVDALLIQIEQSAQQQTKYVGVATCVVISKGSAGLKWKQEDRSEIF